MGPRPSYKPTKRPSKRPTYKPTKRPTQEPTQEPTNRPTATPTRSPTKFPTVEPTDSPTDSPTKSPTMTESPTLAPTLAPINSSLSPSMSPTSAPTSAPTDTPPEQICAAIGDKMTCKMTPGCYFGDKAKGPCSLFSGVCENITNKKTCKGAARCVSKKGRCFSKFFTSPESDSEDCAVTCAVLLVEYGICQLKITKNFKSTLRSH